MLSKKELIQTPEYWLETIQNELYRSVMAYMEEKNINQTQLAKELGVSKGYVSQILNGNFNFTLAKLIELTLAIGLVPNLRLEHPNSSKGIIHSGESKRITPNAS